MKRAPEGGYLPQLDGLRAFAVIAVAISHWTPEFLMKVVPWGTGVQLFFVLSGFLITGILLRNRPAETGTTLGFALKTFYARRVLRIFPLYFGVLALAWLFALGPIREVWPWHVAYLSNFHFAFHGHGPAVNDPFLHLWSLSVEEQFYFFWPLVALVVSRRLLPTILILSIVGSAAFRVMMHDQVESVRYLTPACLDALAVGGLLAWRKDTAGSAGLRQLGWWCFGVGVAGLGFSLALLGRIIDPEAAHRIGHTFLVIAYGGIVAGAAEGFRGPIGAILLFKPLQYLGKISYGIYVFHYFAPIVLFRITQALGVAPLPEEAPLTLLAYTCFSLAAAALSWHCYEHPLNEQKRRFPYPARRAPAVVPEPAKAG